MGGVIAWIPIAYTFNILWVGKFDFRKQFFLALESVARLKDKENVIFHVIAPMTDEQERKINKRIDELGMVEQVKLYGRVPHAKVQQFMKDSDVFLFTSLSEGTPHVVLEAIHNNLPVVCFDTCGQGDVVTENIGIKVPLTNLNDSQELFARAISSLINDKNRLASFHYNCFERQMELSWDSKIKQMMEIYHDVINRVEK